MSWAAVTASVVGAALSVGLAYASQPNVPNATAGSKKASRAQLNALPGQRMVDMAARLGLEVDYPTGRGAPVLETMPIEEAVRRGLVAPNNPRVLLAQERGQTDIMVRTGTTSETAHADFRGAGDADVQGALMRSMAGIGLDLQRRYGADFVDEARRQQEQADPEGTAARRLLAEKINSMEDERENRERPVANALDAQMLEEIQAGRGATGDVAALADRALARREAGGAGGTVDAAGIEAELSRGLRGDKRLAERIGSTTRYLASGSTPEDAAYRDRQQGMANMASFLAGRTPQSQFGLNAAGQRGASPVPQGSPLVGLPQDMQGQSLNAGAQNYALGVRQAATQVNPWFAGLTQLTRGIGAGVAARQPAGAGPV